MEGGHRCLIANDLKGDGNGNATEVPQNSLRDRGHPRPKGSAAHCMKSKNIEKNQVIAFSSAGKKEPENELPWKQDSVCCTGLFHSGKARSAGEPGQGQTFPINSSSGSKYGHGH